MNNVFKSKKGVKIGLLGILTMLMGAGCNSAVSNNSSLVPATTTTQQATTTANSTTTTAPTKTTTTTPTTTTPKSSQTLAFYIQKTANENSLSEAEFKKHKSLTSSFTIGFGDAETKFVTYAISFMTDPNWKDNQKHTFFVVLNTEEDNYYYGPFNDTVYNLFEQAKEKIGKKIDSDDSESVVSITEKK
jgi:hypothetical protein